MLITTCANLSLQAYDPEAPGFAIVDDLRFGIFETSLGRILSIRGTENLKNWLRDARCVPAKTCGGHIAHGGFVDAFRRLCAGGMPTCRGAIDYATGHSLGGAIATLVSEQTGCKLVTFGSPKVYLRFSSAPALDHIRVARDDDPVPMVPGLLYSHRCEPLLLKDGDHHLIQIEDHPMKGYLAALPMAA